MRKKDDAQFQPPLEWSQSGPEPRAKTRHRVFFKDSRRMADLDDASVDLVVTSPPYPMVEMWDAAFSRMNPTVNTALEAFRGPEAFEAMHAELDRVWDEVYRVLKPGAMACINIGDATRSLGGRFALYPNHARVLQRLQAVGLTVLPAILWRKQTNAPNKFMGSGMLPAGAYVTLEHEYVLMARKGARRPFPTPAERARRRESAYFWEERNLWFSDVWFDLKGAGQEMADVATRRRSGAFPFELPYRLIQMASILGDRVLDPFLGVGTTLSAAMATGRNGIGYEIETGFQTVIHARVAAVGALADRRRTERLDRHRSFIEHRVAEGKAVRYHNRHHDVPVVTRQEVDLRLPEVAAVRSLSPDSFEVDYR